VLEAGRTLLAEFRNVRKTPIWAVLYRSMLICLVEAFPNFPVSELRDLIDEAGGDGARQFVEDCWMATVLAHDNGYLPMIELNLRRARRGDWIGPLREDGSRAEDLKDWLGRTIQRVHRSLQSSWGRSGQISLLLPDLETIGIHHDVEYREKPAAIHGAVSGYQMLDYLLEEHGGARPWDGLNLVEKAMAVIVAGASIFHTADVPGLCRKTVTPSRLPPDQIQQFDRLPEAVRGRLKKRFEVAFKKLMRFNPMGVFLYAVDSLEEWVRPTWHTIYSEEAKSFGVFRSEYGERYGLIERLDGLTAIIGQCPVPKSRIKLEKGGKRLNISFHRPPYWDKLHVVGLKEDGGDHRITPGSYDYQRLTGDLQKDALLPAALHALTGCTVTVALTHGSTRTRAAPGRAPSGV
jgi:hypothetical protein